MTTDTHSLSHTHTHTCTHAHTHTHMQIPCFFWYMQSHFRTLSHILLDNTARALLNNAHIWKTSNQYFFFFYFLCWRKIKKCQRRRIQNQKKQKKKKRYSVVIGFDCIPVLSFVMRPWSHDFYSVAYYSLPALTSVLVTALMCTLSLE